MVTVGLVYIYFCSIVRKSRLVTKITCLMENSRRLYSLAVVLTFHDIPKTL